MTAKRTKAARRKKSRSTASPQSAVERKERVLHTRVPESLERQLRHKARDLGLSVSTVVRNVLLNTFGLVEDIVADSANLAISIAGGEPSTAANRRSRERGLGPAQLATIVGWQEAVLNVNAVCDRCNGVVKKGARAAIAVREVPGPRALLCLPCLDEFAGE